jgi:hypothetical protein
LLNPFTLFKFSIKSKITSSKGREGVGKIPNLLFFLDLLFRKQQ